MEQELRLDVGSHFAKRGQGFEKCRSVNGSILFYKSEILENFCCKFIHLVGSSTFLKIHDCISSLNGVA